MSTVPRSPLSSWVVYFSFNDTAPTEIYTLSLHDALPIWGVSFVAVKAALAYATPLAFVSLRFTLSDRKSTRLNSSHANISYAVFCLKKKSTSCQGYCPLPGYGREPSYANLTYLKHSPHTR